jgi:membrane fusion protein (multidrug efflux system)
LAQVLLVDDELRVILKTVQLGAVNHDRWVVTDGLKSGDRIVVEGLQHARPGEKVVIDNSALPLAQASGQ